MHPYISLALSTERARDMRSRAAADRLARQVRRSRHGKSVRPLAAIPDTYEEFLLRTSGAGAGGRSAHEAAWPEPTAAARAGRHSIR